MFCIPQNMSLHKIQTKRICNALCWFQAKAGFILSQIDSIHHQVLVVGSDFKRLHELMRQSWKSYMWGKIMSIRMFLYLYFEVFELHIRMHNKFSLPSYLQALWRNRKSHFWEGLGASFIEFISPFLKNREFLAIFRRKRPWVACEISCSAAEPHP